jgi:hypothetical protein
VIQENPYLKYLLALFPWILGAIFLLAAAHGYSEVASRQQTARGTIVQHEPFNHNRYSYKFQVDGRYYSGWETPLGTEPEIGQSVRIYYDPLYPSENGLRDFAERRDSTLGPAVAILILSVVLTALILLLGPVVSRDPGKGEPPTLIGHVR